MGTMRSTLKSWAEADQALRELGEHEIRIERVNAKATAQMNALKEEAEKAVRPLEEQRLRIERELELFCEERREDFNGSRSRKLNFGTVGWRKAGRVEVPDAEATLAALRARGLAGCIKMKETVDKNELGKQTAAVLADVGASVVQVETFTAKADRARIEVPEG